MPAANVDVAFLVFCESIDAIVCQPVGIVLVKDLKRVCCFVVDQDSIFLCAYVYHSLAVAEHGVHLVG